MEIDSIHWRPTIKADFWKLYIASGPHNRCRRMGFCQFEGDFYCWKQHRSIIRSRRKHTPALPFLLRENIILVKTGEGEGACSCYAHHNVWNMGMRNKALTSGEILRQPPWAWSFFTWGTSTWLCDGRIWTGSKNKPYNTSLSICSFISSSLKELRDRNEIRETYRASEQTKKKLLNKVLHK